MIDIEVEDAAWLAALPDAESLARAAAEAALAYLPRKAAGGGPSAEEPMVEGSGGRLGAGRPAPSTLRSSAGFAPASADGPPPAVAAATGEVGVTLLLTDDESVRELNARFRGRDAATNVLSFPAPPNPECFLGDVALAYGVCVAEAGQQHKPLAHHLQHLVAHGVLHLLGCDHESDAEAEAMEHLERVVLAGLGVADPYAADEGDHD